MAVSGSEEKEGVILKVAFLADDSTAARWWLSLLQQSPGIDLVFLWCRKEEIAEALQNSSEGICLSRRTRVVWGEDKTKEKKERKERKEDEENHQRDLKSILMEQEIKSFIVAANPEHQADLLEYIFSFPEGRKKHIFSCTPPTFDPLRMEHLISLHKQKQIENQKEKNEKNEEINGVWSVCTSFTHEVGAGKIKALLLDLGQLIGGQIICSSLLQNQAVAECGNAATLLKQRSHSEVLRGVCCSLISFLRELFGDVSFLSGVQSPNAGVVAARIHFDPAPCVSLLIDVKCPLTNFEFRAWGVKGYAKLSWDADRKAFEVHRSLQHYEHPTLHPVTGPTGAMKDWVRAVVGRDFAEPCLPPLCSPEKFLEDLTTTHCLLESGGNNVSLKGSIGIARGNKQTGTTLHQQPLRV